jgi:hypothetical protein
MYSYSIKHELRASLIQKIPIWVLQNLNIQNKIKFLQYLFDPQYENLYKVFLRNHLWYFP